MFDGFLVQHILLAGGALLLCGGCFGTVAFSAILISLQYLTAHSWFISVVDSNELCPV